MTSASALPSPGFPPTRRDTAVEHLHGHAVADPYRWLEDGNGPECEAWLEHQARLYTSRAATWPHRSAWQALLRSATARTDALSAVSPPVWRRGRRFFLRHPPGRPLPVLMTAEPGGPARTLLDPLAGDPSGSTTLDAWRPSPSGELVAYQMSYQGDEHPRLGVVDVSTGHVVDGPLDPGRQTPVAWLADDTAFLYVHTPRGGTGRRLRLHRVGTAPGRDPVLFTTDLPQLSVTTSPDGRHLMLSASPGATSGNRLWLARAPHHPEQDLRPALVFDGTGDASRAVLKFAPDGRVYAVTDHGAPFGRLCAVDPADPHLRAWTTVVAEEPGSVLSACVTLTEPGTGRLRLLTAHSRHGVSGLRLHTGDGDLLAEVAAPGNGHVARLTAPPEGASSAWFTYTDFTTPPCVHRFDLATRRCVPDTPPECDTRGTPSAARSAGRAEVREHPRVAQVGYPSFDRTPVRMHLITPPGRTGPLPTLLTAYGGFGASTPPAYSPAIAAWVAAGGAYAIASVRGGGEGGTAWHAAGSGTDKPNAIADFLAAARWLIDQEHTDPDRLAIRGSSHSGFLVAAALTRAPELFAAAVCSDAVTDMLRYERFGIGHLWRQEFGTAEDPDECAALLGYSPYHRVRPGTDYPAVLLTCPRTDPRVDSMHVRKMTAALQHATASDRPVVLRCEDGVGHGPRSLDRSLGLQTDVLAFCAAHTGLVPPPQQHRR